MFIGKKAQAPVEGSMVFLHQGIITKEAAFRQPTLCHLKKQ
jgi:hypothetical protein